MKTFEEICPQWSIIISKLGIEYVLQKCTFNGQLYGCRENFMSLDDSRICFVGEAHGFTDMYCSSRFSKKTCQDCQNFSQLLLRRDDFEQAKSAFVEHWNNTHEKEEKP